MWNEDSFNSMNLKTYHWGYYTTLLIYAHFNYYTIFHVSWAMLFWKWVLGWLDKYSKFWVIPTNIPTIFLGNNFLFIYLFIFFTSSWNSNREIRISQVLAHSCLKKSGRPLSKMIVCVAVVGHQVRSPWIPYFYGTEKNFIYVFKKRFVIFFPFGPS